LPDYRCWHWCPVDGCRTIDLVRFRASPEQICDNEPLKSSLEEVLSDAYSRKRRVVIVDRDVAHFAGVNEVWSHIPATPKTPRETATKFVIIVRAAEYSDFDESPVDVRAIFVKRVVKVRRREEAVEAFVENVVDCACDAKNVGMAVGSP